MEKRYSAYILVVMRRVFVPLALLFLGAQAILGMVGLYELSYLTFLFLMFLGFAGLLLIIAGLFLIGKPYNYHD